MQIFILISNGGDGSYYPRYVNDPAIIARLEQLDSEGKLNPEYTPGYDGDGFHYETITVPDTCTEESLGITFSSMEELYDENEEGYDE